MNKVTFASCTIIFFTLLVAAPQATLANNGNLLKDPSFELRLPPDQGGWIRFDESMLSADEARNGDHSMFNWGFSRSVQYPPYFLGTVSGSFQEFATGPGSRWRMTGYGATTTKLEGGPAFGIVQVSFFDALGNDLGTVETADNPTPLARISNKVSGQTPAGEWTFLDTGVATAPAGTATIQAFTLYVDFSGSDTSQGVFFDDLSLCPVEDDDGSACK